MLISMLTITIGIYVHILEECSLSFKEKAVLEGLGSCRVSITCFFFLSEISIRKKNELIFTSTLLPFFLKNKGHWTGKKPKTLTLTNPNPNPISSFRRRNPIETGVEVKLFFNLL
jgi:hypothetical protein